MEKVLVILKGVGWKKFKSYLRGLTQSFEVVLHGSLWASTILPLQKMERGVGNSLGHNEGRGQTISHRGANSFGPLVSYFVAPFPVNNDQSLRNAAASTKVNAQESIF